MAVRKSIESAMIDLRTLYNNNKGSIIFFLRNVIFVSLWGCVSLCSSYNDIITYWNIDVPSFGMSLERVVLPLIIWMAAFFLDFIITMTRPPKGYEINMTNVKASQCLMFVFLALTAVFIGRYHDPFLSELCFWGIFVSMMVFKWLTLQLFYKHEQSQ